MTDRSQYGEGKIIQAYFGDFTGTLLDIGANDGATFSMSLDLIERGWSGVLVEPSPVTFPKLVALHAGNPRVIQVNAAITTHDGPLTLWDSGTHLGQGDTSLLSTTVPSEMDRWKKSGERFTPTHVDGITFKTLLARTGIAHFDFISIDAEGADWDILQQMDLDRLGCRCLCVETNNVENDKFVRYCAQYGMRLHHKNLVNLVFVR